MAETSAYAFRPSATFQYFCAGSTNATKALPRPASEWAERGTRIHSAVATGALLGTSDISTVASTALAADAEALNLAQECLDELNVIIEQCGTDWTVEEHLDIGRAIGAEYAGKIGGTADFVGYDKVNRRVHLADIKTGETPVNPTTVQLRCYAVGASALYAEFESVRVHVIQPSIKHIDGERAHSHDYTRAELDEQRRWLAERIDAGLEPDALRTAGTWCKYCPALALCREAAELTFGVAAAAQMAGAPDTLEPAVISRIVWMSDLVSEFVKAVQAHATDVLKAGGTLPQLKLTRGNVQRRIEVVKAPEAIAALAAAGADLDVVAPRKITTPAALERAGFKEIAKTYASRGVGAYRAVHRDVRAKEVPPPSAERGFDAIEGVEAEFDSEL
jgi:hypothetical protein